MPLSIVTVTPDMICYDHYQYLFRINPDDPLIDVYHILEKHQKRIQVEVYHRKDTDRMIGHIEGYRIGHIRGNHLHCDNGLMYVRLIEYSNKDIFTGVLHRSYW